MLKVFHGYDPREGIGTYIWENSVLKRASEPVAFTSLARSTLGPVLARSPALADLRGTNDFIFTRFLVPMINRFQDEVVIFTDGADMVVLDDLAKLRDEHVPGTAVSVVTRPDYIATTPKYRGSSLEAPNVSYPRKQWSAVMTIDTGHYAWRTVDWSNRDPDYWHGFRFLNGACIGSLDPRWNRIADEGDPVDDARILHFTLGVPAIYEHRKGPGVGTWFAEAMDALRLDDPRWQGHLAAVAQDYVR
jgi:hypothetical protein